MSSRDLAEASQAEKATEALLRDACSALRRIDKMVLAASDDADAHHLAEAAQDAMGRLVNHRVRGKRQRPSAPRCPGHPPPRLGRARAGDIGVREQREHDVAEPRAGRARRLARLPGAADVWLTAACEQRRGADAAWP
ncbi:MAG: hypothetical protein JF887_00405 [Candidatus Dormibacteraeota bacterium]|uniref:Uncharacterized protein n=1 Tax=Candidatus Amunia macphersoniae TaxID=3127014 RepID=A0A934NEY5_9BACT|nr:hypothetical protein [Candidatus Dormibacteraeota bacterium]